VNRDRLIVGTRKGLFVFETDGARPGRWQQAEHHFVGEPVSSALADPRDGTLYAALNLGHFGVKLHRLPAGEREWQPCNTPVYPPQPEGAEASASAQAAQMAGPDDALAEARSAAASAASEAVPPVPEPLWSLEQI